MAAWYEVEDDEDGAAESGEGQEIQRIPDGPTQEDVGACEACAEALGAFYRFQVSPSRTAPQQVAHGDAGDDMDFAPDPAPGFGVLCAHCFCDAIPEHERRTWRRVSNGQAMNSRQTEGRGRT